MNKDKELELRKKMGDKAYYKKRLEDDRMTLKILKLLALILSVTSLIIFIISILSKQYYWTLGWTALYVVLMIAGIAEWKLIAKRRPEYMEKYNKNEIVKRNNDKKQK